MPSPPSFDVAQLTRALDRAIKEPLEVGERKAILDFVRTELPAFCVSGRTTYLVLGSYRNEYEKNLRLVQSELNKRTDTFASVVGDLCDPAFEDRPAFAIKLHLTATYADWVIGVYEKESGGEAPELGVMHAVYFEKTHVLPRDYAWMTGTNVDSADAARRTALEIFFNQDLTDEEKEAELEGLYRIIKENGIGVTAEELKELIRRREVNGEGPTTYSWVHMSFFRDFELADQCHPWYTKDELRTQACVVPGPAHPRWKTD